MEEIPLTLKGTQQGILLKPQSEDWAEILSALEDALRDAEDFFRGGRVILELGTKALTEAHLLAVRALLDQYEMELWAILSEDQETIHLTRSYGIRTRLPGETATHEKPADTPENNALLIQRTFRSGQSMKYPGHIVILGDVNPGAEIIAGGNIIVWGRIRGMVHAGALGDESAIVCALDLAPSQLRIAGHISRAPEERRHSPQPEMASIDQNRIIAQPWTARG